VSTKTPAIERGVPKSDNNGIQERVGIHFMENHGSTTVIEELQEKVPSWIMELYEDELTQSRNEIQEEKRGIQRRIDLASTSKQKVEALEEEIEKSNTSIVGINAELGEIGDHRNHLVAGIEDEGIFKGSGVEIDLGRSISVRLEVSRGGIRQKFQNENKFLVDDQVLDHRRTAFVGSYVDSLLAQGVSVDDDSRTRLETTYGAMAAHLKQQFQKYPAMIDVLEIDTDQAIMIQDSWREGGNFKLQRASRAKVAALVLTEQFFMGREVVGDDLIQLLDDYDVNPPQIYYEVVDIPRETTLKGDLLVEEGVLVDANASITQVARLVGVQEGNENLANDILIKLGEIDEEATTQLNENATRSADQEALTQLVQSVPVLQGITRISQEDIIRFIPAIVENEISVYIIKSVRSAGNPEDVDSTIHATNTRGSLLDQSLSGDLGEYIGQYTSEESLTYLEGVLRNVNWSELVAEINKPPVPSSEFNDQLRRLEGIDQDLGSIYDLVMLSNAVNQLQDPRAKKILLALYVVQYSKMIRGKIYSNLGPEQKKDYQNQVVLDFSATATAFGVNPNEIFENDPIKRLFS
jgi:hypothetical protein